MSRRQTAALAAILAAVASIGLLLVILSRAAIHVPPQAVEEATARPRLRVDEAWCAATRDRYHRELDAANHCASDDACLAEARGDFFTDLDACARFLPTTAPRKDLDGLADQWLAGGCAHDFLTCAGAPRARCVEGRCVERAPLGVPQDGCA